MDKKLAISIRHGFTKRKSCLTNLKTFYNRITGQVNEGTAVDIDYMNFKKALRI